MPISKRTLAERIATLSSIQQREILKIIRSSNVPISSNDNGHFFDMEDVPPDCLVSISDFVQYSLANQSELDEYERRMQTCKFGDQFNADARSGPMLPSEESADERLLPVETADDPAAVAPSVASALPVKFSNCKKRLNKPPRGKAYDPDDVSNIVR